MKTIHAVSQVVAVSCLFALASAQEATEDPPQSSAETHWAAISQCAAMLDADSRHSCTDEVLRKAGLLPAETKSAEQRKRFGLRSTTRGTSTTENSEDSENDQVEVTLAAVDQTADGKLLLTTTEGAVWRQIESENVRPTPVQGQTMIIRKASLGSFICKPSKWASFRCSRTR